jgi:DNA-binding transcriptional regulator YiaG
MSRIEKKYVFTGFGFDVLLHNIEIKSAFGEDYPELNLNEVKLLTAKELLVSRERLTGKKLKFLRTFLKASYQKLSAAIDVPPSTIRSWEEKEKEATGMSSSQERQFRVIAIEAILDLEKKHIEKQIIMSDSFETPSKDVLDIGVSRDYSFMNEN